jgi:hypothetical protein
MVSQSLSSSHDAAQGNWTRVRIKVNGVPASLIARTRPDEAWDLRCIDPLVGEFRLRSGDTLHLWSEELGEWLPASELDLAEFAVREAERG